MTPAEAMRAWILRRSVDDLELGIRTLAMIDRAREAQGVPLRSRVTIADAVAAHELGREAFARLPGSRSRAWHDLEDALVEAGLVEAGGAP